MNSDADRPVRITRDDEHGRYDLTIDGEMVAFADFAPGDDMITIPYIETDPRHRGNGYSSLLMNGVIDDLRARHLQVRATCPVARAHIAQHAAELLVR